MLHIESLTQCSSWTSHEKNCGYIDTLIHFGTRTSENEHKVLLHYTTLESLGVCPATKAQRRILWEKWCCPAGCLAREAAGSGGTWGGAGDAAEAAGHRIAKMVVCVMQSISM
jgi:hypothetical protein